MENYDTDSHFRDLQVYGYREFKNATLLLIAENSPEGNVTDLNIKPALVTPEFGDKFVDKMKDSNKNILFTGKTVFANSNQIDFATVAEKDIRPLEESYGEMSGFAKQSGFKSSKDDSLAYYRFADAASSEHLLDATEDFVSIVGEKEFHVVGKGDDRKALYYDKSSKMVNIASVNDLDEIYNLGLTEFLDDYDKQHPESVTDLTYADLHLDANGALNTNTIYKDNTKDGKEYAMLNSGILDSRGNDMHVMSTILDDAKARTAQMKTAEIEKRRVQDLSRTISVFDLELD